MGISRAVFVSFATAAAALCQVTGSSGEVRGLIVDPTGGAVAGAKVALSRQEAGYQRTSVSTSGGAFAFLLVPPGTYSMRLEAPGFTAKVLDRVEVHVGSVVSLRIPLSLSAVETEVMITADVAAIETERTHQANTIESQRIQNLPINRRNYLDFAVLSPGVVDTTNLVDDTSFRPVQTPNSGLSFGGSNGRGNGFYIDGVENYNLSGGVRPSISQEAVLEFQINRNSFTAEFGNASGGVINIITKSGANELHGNVFGFLRHRDIQARNYFDPGKSAFTRVQAGATLGGAISADRTFYFLSYELLRRRETNFVPILQDTSLFSRLTPGQSALFTFFEASGNPLLAGLARQGRALLTPANNSGLVRLFAANSGNFPFKESANQVSGRLDHRFNDRHSAFFRTNATWNPQENSAFGALDGYNRGRKLDFTDWTSMLGHIAVLSSNWSVETRLMFNYNPFAVTPNDPFGPEININGFGLFGRQIFLPYSGIERHFQAIQNFHYSSNRHTVQFGYDVNPTWLSQESQTFLGGRFTFGSRIPLASVLISATGDPNFPAQLGQILAQSGQSQLIPAITQPISALQSFALGIPELYQQGFGSPNYVNRTTRLHFYGQDTWRVSTAFTLNFGVRYENEFLPSIVPADRNNVAPRLGFAWSPGSDRKTVIRGGYGLYYSQIHAQVPGVAEPLSGRFINQVLLTPTSALFRHPATGQFVTSATVYQQLLAQGVIGNRPITEADLSQFGIRVGPNLPGSVVFGIDGDFVNPWAHQASFEVERDVAGFTVSAGYNFNRAAHLARTLGRNVRYTGQRLPDGRPLFERINPLILQTNIFESGANSFYHAGILQVSRRYSRDFSMNLSYTLSRAIDESTDFNSDYSPNDQLNARAERALSAFHQKHRVVLSAVYQSQVKQALFKDWNVAPIFVYNSWRPFNVLTGVDAQGDTYVNTKRPAHLGRNMGQGPDFAAFDLRISRRFGYGTRESQAVELIAEGFNLLNRTNFRSINNVVGDVPISALPSPITGNRGAASSPLAFTSALNPRQFQFGLKLFW